MEAFPDLIRRVFPVGSPPPGRLTSHLCSECDEVDRILSKMTWPEVAADFPSYCHDAFPLLTLDAKVYYLPAWLIASVAEVSGLQGTSLESSLGRSELPCDRFSTDQRGGILRWGEMYFVHLMGTNLDQNFVQYWSVV